MSIPANALSDEECLHYAALEPSAAAELTRRLTAQSIDPRAEQEELQERMRRIEDDADEVSGELSDLQDSAEEACEWIRRAMSPDDQSMTINQFLQKALDCLE
ncbi:hypothetical protein [Pseudomonas fluorescens]|uniref:hypothetical protein n=1 Tax=Pseudomonas fluorescens TaxID=294 RepID=UPI000AF778D0|nr:hypothetical protein [Pseudomonas fluorescens]